MTVSIVSPGFQQDLSYCLCPSRFWFLKFLALLACCAGGFFLPGEEKFLEGKIYRIVQTGASHFIFTTMFAANIY